MIQWAHFSRVATAQGMVRDRDREFAWSIPISVVMAFRDGAIYIVPNSIDALDAPKEHHLCAFVREGEVDAAFATYHLMNQGG